LIGIDSLVLAIECDEALPGIIKNKLKLELLCESAEPFGLGRCFKNIHLLSSTQMTTASIYLIFNGNCREAFEFYKSALGGEYESVSTFGEMPPQEGQPAIPEDVKDLIMHVTLRIGESFVLMGSDDGGSIGPEVTVGNNFSVMVTTDSVEETDRIFGALSEGGQVTMPLANTFWDSYFGMLTDRFGVSWMVSGPLSAA